MQVHACSCVSILHCIHQEETLIAMGYHRPFPSRWAINFVVAQHSADSVMQSDYIVDVTRSVGLNPSADCYISIALL